MKEGASICSFLFCKEGGKYYERKLSSSGGGYSPSRSRLPKIGGRIND